MRKAANHPVYAVLGALLAMGCASAPPAGNWEQVRVLEKNEEGMEHLALPTKMDGCDYLGRVRTSAPADARGAGPTMLETLRRKAARMGGDTLALLPGRPIFLGSLRGSVFRCGSGA